MMKCLTFKSNYTNCTSVCPNQNSVIPSLRRQENIWAAAEQAKVPAKAGVFSLC